MCIALFNIIEILVPVSLTKLFLSNILSNSAMSSKHLNSYANLSMCLINLMVQWSSHLFAPGFIQRSICYGLPLFHHCFFFHLLFLQSCRCRNRLRLIAFLSQSHLALLLFYSSSYPVLIFTETLILRVFPYFCPLQISFCHWKQVL